MPLAPPPPPAPSPEPWRATLSIPSIYRCPSNGEWAGYNAFLLQLAPEDGIVIMEDDDNDGSASADAKSKLPIKFLFHTIRPLCTIL
jgi:hypothetical protein